MPNASNESFGREDLVVQEKVSLVGTKAIGIPPKLLLRTSLGGFKDLVALKQVVIKDQGDHWCRGKSSGGKMEMYMEIVQLSGRVGMHLEGIHHQDGIIGKTH
ncbi:hypothetical protein NE237_009161 [Protea cynaroides]|uniref:Uncharacterized protein n=1 Tax=Protea cynaroides TaxID=273540 RepID=A0A9Q0KY33_9MAGN|nr:hypothetical protein NE237_009161 [Protea cynaroides]